MREQKSRIDIPAAAEPRATPAAAARTPRAEPPSDGGRLFKGRKNLAYLLWANKMALLTGLTLFPLGGFSMLWSKSHIYDCRTGDGHTLDINDIYLDVPLNDPSPNSTSLLNLTSTFKCDAGLAGPDLHGNMLVGQAAIVLGIFLLLFESEPYGWGCYFPSDSMSHEMKISFRGIIYILISLPFYSSSPVALSAFFLTCTGLVNLYGVRRGEVGDDGRARSKKSGPAKKKERETPYVSPLNVVKYYRKLVDEDLLSAYVWVTIYFVCNVVTFTVTLKKWTDNVLVTETALVDGTLETDCGDAVCLLNRVFVQQGGISRWGPYAKACGMCLNFNCSVIIYPVVRLLLRKLNNIGTSFVHNAANPTIFQKFFASPISRYVPLSKNIEFHKIVACTMGTFAVAHTMFHFMNFYYAKEATFAVFKRYGVESSAFISGFVILVSMFFIFAAASDKIRHAHYEIFFSCHHWFVVFFSVLLLHGPIFYQWAFVPLSLYIWERISKQSRGAAAYYVNKVEWIEPVMAVQFRPLNKLDFVHREGQYLYLNCPAINNEWHPFTISSAPGDLGNGPRISLDNGEEVIEVPRPKGLPKEERWNKFCPISKDYTKINTSQLLDKHETGYNDFVSVHIKVHGLELPHAKTWTRKLKEYFELMHPQGTFPFYFSHRDDRGDLIVGRQFGPDGGQILRVDGPHSAPSEHYSEYSTSMVIGAGIGLTPCASILTALLKYQWKKNFSPEILHFYWMVRQADIDSYQWLIHQIAELEYGLKHAREQNQIGPQYYCEINVYVTGAKKEPVPVPELKQKESLLQSGKTNPSFRAQKLYAMMMNPPSKSSSQVELQNGPNAKTAPNRLQDCWMWNGRPNWEAIFKQNKKQRQHNSIGVCFCGAAVIGKDLEVCCKKYSSVEEDCLFNLHKENF
jgi:hypothetical protein